MLPSSLFLQENALSVFGIMELLYSLANVPFAAAL
jgi:hypothetical protein